ncbi:Nramp family divalent metal transporter [Herbiconiux sp. P17]|uniref:Nramp family divalent metal transporter n=2 Tax=Herbiconiux wuyangfengii TaxID=3342794 RepID=UPI0035B97A2B
MPKNATAQKVSRPHPLDLPGARPRWWHSIAMFGPAFVASIAYVDPGNVAANLTSGAQYGYLLVWVLVLANAMAVLIQFQSAKLGIVTGKTLPEHVGARTRPWGRRAYWLQAEIVAAATDIAEVLGGAIALNLLFGVPLVMGGVIVGLVSMGLLLVQNARRQRTFEFMIIGLLAVIAFGFLAGVFVSNVDWFAAADGLVPRFEGAPTVLLAASMLGATVMPHAIYLHSALARDRHHVEFAALAEKSDFTGESVRARRADAPAESDAPTNAPEAARLAEAHVAAEAPIAVEAEAEAPAPTHGASRERLRRLLRVTRADVVVALVLAGAVNIAMLLLAASSLRGVDGTDTIPGAYAAIQSALGPAIATIFAIGLLASGLASTSVGAYAGSVIMKGLLRIRVPIIARRVVTLIPALIVLGVGIDPTWALVLSQVLLSIGIPFALIPLIRLTGNRALMGEFADRMPVRIIAWIVVALIVCLNVVLIFLTVTGAGVAA